jgi:hypothetical protein
VGRLADPGSLGDWRVGAGEGVAGALSVGDRVIGNLLMVTEGRDGVCTNPGQKCLNFQAANIR